MTRATLRRPRRTSYRPHLDLLEDRCLLSTYLVDRLSDGNPGGPGQGSGLAGDLRYCITQANTIAGDDNIDFSVTGNIQLAGALPSLSSNIDIRGPGASSMAVRRNTGGRYRIFTADSGITGVLSGLTITNGGGSGAGIFNSGTLTLNDVTVSGNDSTAGFGAGIHNGGTLTLNNSTVSGNSGSDQLFGGGISNSGTLTLNYSTVSGNDSAFEGSAGGIDNYGTATLNNSTVSANSADYGGGGIRNYGTLRLNSSIVSNNTEYWTGGGGILNYGILTVIGSFITSNFSYSGAGIYNRNGGTVTLTNTTVSGNAAGGIFNLSGTVILNNSSVSGHVSGGILNRAGPVTLNNSTISGNSSLGGIYNFDTLTLNNSTVSGNNSNSSGFGGGITNTIVGNSNPTVLLVNSTIANNTASSSDRTGSQIYTGRESGTGAGQATVQFRNTIIAGSGVRPTLFTDTGGTFVSQGHNLSSDSGSGLLTGPGDLVNTNPMLGPLQDNGGRTFTHALLPGSPALNAGDNTGAPATDQRGFSRIVKGTIDIGAYEAQNIVDDSHTTDFSVTSGWYTGFPGQGYLNSVSVAFAGIGTEIATWTFSGLSAGYYRVSATWSEYPNRPTSAPYAVRDGMSVLGTVLVNQQRAPHHFVDNGRPWFNLGGVYTLIGNTLVVELTNAANNEHVIADAVRVEQVTMGPLPPIVDDGDTNFLATPGFVSVMEQGYGADMSFAVGTGGEVAIWGFSVIPGVYRVSATWTAHENRATDAPFYVFDGNDVRGFVTVNQELPPDDFSEGGTLWKDLGSGAYTVTSGALYVALTNDANGYVTADAVRIERLG